MTLPEAIRAYYEKFDEGPPIFEMDETEALSLIEKALESGEPIDEPAPPPSDVYL